MRRVRKKSRTLPILSISILIIIVFLGIFAKSIIDKPIKSDENLVIDVKAGDSLYGILDSLASENKIKFSKVLKLYIKATKKNIDLKSGRYVLDNNLSMDSIIHELNANSQKQVKFTIPEGYSIDDISKKLEDEGICKSEDFKKAIKNYNLPKFVKDDSKKRYDLEGYLFPDTYLINENEEPNSIIQKMLIRFEQVLNQAMEETNTNIKNEDIENIITRASIIEKEANVDKERPTIASVINNRLEKSMNLQIDATVIYALGKHVDKVLYSHLETDSPYNTYKNEGLPVGPISNPGLSSIEAVLKPEKTDYLYYVAQNDKTHYFTNDYDDFINKQKELGY